jgi:hypothetical protein
MNKSIELPQATIQALKDGATSIIVPMGNMSKGLERREALSKHFVYKEYFDEFISAHSPLQAGDKDVFVKEEFMCINSEYFYKEEYTQGNYKVEPSFNVWDSLENAIDKHQPSSQMTKEQSRFNIDIEDVRIVRVQDIDFDTKQDIFPYQRIIQCYDEEQFANDDFIDKFNNLIQEYEDKHFTETGERISLGNYEDNPYVFLYDAKVTTKEFYKEPKDK